MSTKYKFHDPDGIYFVSFAVVNWIDVFSRQVYKDILIEAFRFCTIHKGLVIHAYVIMTNHVHLIISRNGNNKLEDTIRDLKKFSSARILKEIRNHASESRKDWMLELFAKAGKANGNNTYYQFWGQDNHPVELSGYKKMLMQRLNYLHENPVAAGIVDTAEHYRYSSAINYAGGRGVLEVSIL